MNIQPRHIPLSARPAPAGFTLIELMVVIAIIAVLAAISIGGFGYATKNANRNETRARLEFIRTSLESYYHEYGEYPAVLRNQGATTTISGVQFEYGPAAALYQAISGDGDDHIVQGGTPSNGEFTAEEARRGIAELNPSAYREFATNVFSMVDGFGQPFLYVRYDPNNPDSTRNPTYDLWSVADADTPGQTSDAGTNDDPSWIKNW